MSKEQTVNTGLHQRRDNAGLLSRIETDPAHHLTGPFMTQTPLGGNTPSSDGSPVSTNGDGFPSIKTKPGFWDDIKTFRWIVNPASSFKILFFFVILWANWEVLAPYVAPSLSNPFEPLLFISHQVPSSLSDDPRYQKGYLDLVFVAFHIVFFCFLRQVITITIGHPAAKYFGIRKHAKVDRFGEQSYAVVYFAVMGAWGYRVMAQLPTYWFQSKCYWIDYPHWDMKPELKRYYLTHGAYWCQQLIVLLLGLEKPRKDYAELVVHHFVTIWLIGWSYLVNMTRLGNAVYLSMDIPDTFLSASMLLNYMRWEKSKTVAYIILLITWTYFRQWLNLKILWSVWFEYDLVSEAHRRWAPETGAWLTWWLKYQMFGPLLMLQFLNIFWYFLILRIGYRAVTQARLEDERSDDEDDGVKEDDEPSTNKKSN
ncbi:longevity assurance proteins LAG1 LAC1 [Coniophora puteana RWD-64-598 SS2]|uniref:Longevity assurance proteins LAG1 LAC1 n=1 Tax=Coniophora puteana (strain RWD-64-598) TaxID=741705 RepID=A0A5M3MJX3_CONPW|nr:longevity assurance proteins LAG1 LAC1 [Coniophora puteana RWD-64-598 SS2]EIW79356.1 longevity assurance proteins LAG1 LAC1 [Coniophora puteana RWD-64-598 SS2]